MKKRIITMTVGDMKFTMPDTKETSGHDDGTPFTGTLNLDGEPFARCSNDGWGGPAMISPLTDEKKFQQVSEEVKKYFIRPADCPINLDMSIDFIADMLAPCQLGQFDVPDQILKHEEA